MTSLLIADSGSTKTEWRLVQSGQPVRAVRTDGLNPYFQDETQLVGTLQAQLLPQLPTLVTPVDIHFYGTGCTGGPSNARMANALQAVLPAAQTISIASDMLGAAVGVAGTSAGIVCILGTGSNACFFDGKAITTPGYSLGFWLGDEGSGGNLGKRLVTTYLHGKLPADLRQVFEAKHPLDRLTVLDHAYNQSYPNRYFARFAPFLSENRAAPFVRALVCGAFADFIELYIQRIPDCRSFPVHVVGSIAHYFGDWLRDELARHGLQTGQFLQVPIDGLLIHHLRDVATDFPPEQR